MLRWALDMTDCPPFLLPPPMLFPSLVDVDARYSLAWVVSLSTSSQNME